MSKWPGKFVIGLTGNIATGKSVVRKMMEHLGAYGIDADALGHRAMSQGAPGYQQVLDHFGKWVLGPDGQIDRARLARVVFADPDALQSLEAILHPLIRQAIDIFIRRSPQQVVVIEAIKLLEGPLKDYCDAVCVAYAAPQIQLARLMQKRGMTEEVARMRISAQPSQEEKMAKADFIIRNEGSFEDTWRQVSAMWQTLFPASDTGPAAVEKPMVKGEIAVERARPRQASEIAALITRLSGGARQTTREDIMAAFGEKAFVVLRSDNRLAGLAGWQVENLVSRTDDVFLEPGLPVKESLRKMIEEVEKNSRDLQCEASLLFLPPELARHEEVLRPLGYEVRDVRALGVRDWVEAAQESMPKGTVLLFKQLRKDRVLKPV